MFETWPTLFIVVGAVAFTLVTAIEYLVRRISRPKPVIDYTVRGSMPIKNHDHTLAPVCEHRMKRCSQCETAYCTKCRREWPNPFLVSWPDSLYIRKDGAGVPPRCQH